MKRLFLVLTAWLMFLSLTGCAIQPGAQNLKKLPTHSVPVTNGRIEYYQYGSGSPIVMIPGYGTDISSWNQAFILALGQQHQLIMLNNRNVGRSAVKTSQYESKDLANDVYQLIQQLGLKKPTVLGISMGGMIAQQLAVSHPDKLGQLILINTVIAGKQAVAPSAAVKKEMLRKPKNLLDRYTMAMELFFPANSRVTMSYELVVDRFQPMGYKPVDSATILPVQQQLVWHWITDNATAKKISQLNLPVLILNGNADIVIPPVNSVILARNIPAAQLLRWEGGGHGMLYQYPNQIAHEINYFIDEQTWVID